MTNSPTEPMLVGSMRRRPTGDVRHTPEEGGAGGTSTQGFLREYDRAIAEAERRGAVKALRSIGDWMYPVPSYLRIEQRADAIENGADL